MHTKALLCGTALAFSGPGVSSFRPTPPTLSTHTLLRSMNPRTSGPNANSMVSRIPARPQLHMDALPLQTTNLKMIDQLLGAPANSYLKENANQTFPIHVPTISTADSKALLKGEIDLEELPSLLNEDHKTPINCGIFLPTNQPQVDYVVIASHGFGDSAEKLQNVQEAFTENGAAFVSFDQRGHGSSVGMREDGLSWGQPGHTRNLMQLYLDLDAVARTTAKTFPDTPIILWSHSMGAGINLGALANFFQKNEEGDFISPIDGTPLNFAGFEAQSPWLGLSKKVRPILLAFGTAIHTVAPRFVFHWEQSKGEKIPITAASFLMMGDNAQHVFDNADKIGELPGVILHFPKDRITSSAVSRLLHRKIDSSSVMFVKTHGGHSPYREGRQDKIDGLTQLYVDNAARMAENAKQSRQNDDTPETMKDVDEDKLWPPS